MTIRDTRTGLPVGDAVAAHAAKRPERVEIAGKHVLLRPIDLARDAAPLYAATCTEATRHLWQYLGPEMFEDRESFDRWLDRCAGSDDPFFYTIAARQDGAPLGVASLMRIDPANRVIEVGNILFTPALQRSVAATESMYLFAKYAFEDLGNRRYEWKCNALNVPSRRAAIRFGFTFEGIFRQHLIVKGHNRNTAWYSMLDAEWPARKAAFETWLAPDNFDASGRQRLSLRTLNASVIDGAGL